MPAGPRDCAHCGLPVPEGRGRGAGPAAAFCCFGCRFAHELARPAAAPGASAGGSTTLVLRLGFGIFLALNIMVFNWVFYSQQIFEDPTAEAAHGALGGLFAYLLLFLCTAVIVVLGFPLAADAWENTRAAGRGRRVDANLLICIGVGSAYLLSVIHTVRGRGSLYYDTAAMVLVIVTLGLYLEARARRRTASAASAALAEESRSPIRAGDELPVRAGEAFVADGLLVEGESRVDESWLTGESRPRAVAAGDRVLAGTINLDGPLRLRAEAVGGDRVVARVERLIETARHRQPAIQRAADRAAAVFVPAVVAVAAVAFVLQVRSGSATAGLFRALAVLLVSCPCALGLAAPLAIWNALRRAAARGILFDSATTLERASRVRAVFFDKTGTLTETAAALEGIDTAPGTSAENALAVAAALEATTLHPVASAILDAARRRGVEVGAVEGARTLPGIGVEGVVRGRRYRLGGERLVEAPQKTVLASDAATTVFLVAPEGVLARFRLKETLRPDAAPAIARLRRSGIAVRVLSGDRPAAARAIGEALGVPAEGGLLPEDKLYRLAEARSRDPLLAIAVVGDGINDAPVLAAADVGVALGSATDLARQAGHVHLIADRLDRVPLLLATARHAIRRVRLNLAWAFGYNTVAIAAAAAGWLSPVHAAAAMVLSSLTVVAISRGAGRIAEEDTRTVSTESPSGDLLSGAAARS